jgi:hypothetical protein
MTILKFIVINNEPAMCIPATKAAVTTRLPMGSIQDAGENVHE